MGLFSLRRLAGEGEDPDRTLRKRIGDLRLELLWARKRAIAALTNEKRLRKQLDREKTQAGAWRRRAELARKKGNELLARTALENWTMHQQVARDLRSQAEAVHGAVEGLKAKMQQLRAQLSEYEQGGLQLS